MSPSGTASYQRRLELPAPRSPEDRLQIFVIYTSEEGSRAALQTAAALASELDAHIELIVPQVVPFPSPLTTPTVVVEWNEDRLQQIAAEIPVETSVHVFLCRDREQTVMGALNPNSLVVVGGCKRRLWPNAETRLARRLRRSGHHVVLS